MRRTLVPIAALALAAAAAACSATETSAPTTSAARDQRNDVRLLVEGMESLHPDLFHAVTRARLDQEALALEEAFPGLSPDERLVGLMRLAALPGERDGHSGIFPLDVRHDRTLHLYSLRLYDFADGLHVVAAPGRPGLVGSRLVAVAGVPAERLARQVAPLVPHDNELSLRARLPQYLVTAEVLRGLGVVDGPAPVAFTLARGGRTRDVVLEPRPAGEYAAAFPDLFDPLVPQGLPRRAEPLWLAQRLRARSLALVDGGRAVYAGYNVTLGDTSRFADRIVAGARRPGVERVVVDLRHNPGGENGTYPPVLGALRHPAVDRRGRLYVLIGRTTFSAAAQLATELERRTSAIFVGERSGGSPNHYGDPDSIRLRGSGLNVNVAGVYWQIAAPDDERLALEPDIHVELPAADFFSGRDPVLRAALRAER